MACTTDADCCGANTCATVASNPNQKICHCFPTVQLFDVCGGPVRPSPVVGVGGGDAGTDGGPVPMPPRPRISGWLYSPTSVDILPTYTHVIATGNPTGIAVTELANYITNAPDSLRSVDVGTPAPLRVNLGLARQPLTLETTVFAGVAPDDRTFEAVIGEVGRATWYTIVSGAIARESAFPLTTTPPSPTIRVVGTSLHPLADSGQQEVAIATADPARVFYYSMDAATPIHRADVPIAGTIVGITTGPTEVWVASMEPTTNRLTRLITPALTTSPTTGSAPLTAIPLAIDGGGSMLTGGGNFIVVLVAGAGATPPQIRAYAGGAPTGIPITFPITMGTPVGVHTSSRETPRKHGRPPLAPSSRETPRKHGRPPLAPSHERHRENTVAPRSPPAFEDRITYYL